MFSNKNRIIFSLSITAVLCFQGCAFERKPQVVRDEIDSASRTVIPSDIIDERIAGVREVLKKDAVPEEKKEIALSLIDMYSRLQSFDANNAEESEYTAIIKGLFDNLGMVEKNYFYTLDDSDREARRSIMSDYIEIEDKISENYLIGNYKGVISQCAEFETEYGRESLTPEIGLFFALSLAREDMVLEALSIGKETIKNMELNADSILLLANIIKWELEIGNRDDALGYFEKLLDTMNEKNALFKKTEKLFSEDENSVDLSVLPDSDLYGTYRPENAAAEAKLKRVEKLIEEENFSEARLLLLRWRLRAEEGPEVELIEHALKSVEAAEEKLKKEDTTDKIKLDDARELIESEKYKEAIKVLESINNEALEPEVDKEMKKAVEKLINKKRLEAAVLFRKAKESSDTGSKKTLLLSSKRILEDLIETYPESNLVEKLRNHLSKVNDDLENLP